MSDMSLSKLGSRVAGTGWRSATRNTKPETQWKMRVNSRAGCPFDFWSLLQRIVRVAGLATLALLQTQKGFSDATDVGPTVILVIGAPGESEYGTNFLQQATLWQKACTQAEARSMTVGLDYPAGTNDYDCLKQMLLDEPKQGSSQLWIVLIGHGTFDGREARFNLRGPDVSATELAQWLQAFRRPLVIINTSPSSGPFLNKLSATNRVVITASRTGNEQNFTRFGQYFAQTLIDPQADIDQDGEVSLLESFLTASRQVNEFYKSKGRLVTEHSLIDDNGDGLGTPAEWFRGLRATKRAKDGAALDGLLAQQFRLIPSPAERAFSPEQIAQRDALEKQVLILREKKPGLPEEDYYRDLEALLVQLAKFYTTNSSSNLAPR